MRDQAEIVDRRAASVFASPRQRKILFALIHAERSLSQLGGATEMPLNLLHHHVRKFLGLGLVEIVREERRAGAPIKIYRAVARAFFVPAELMVADPGARSATHLRELLEQSLAGNLKGAVYEHDGSGPRMRLVRDAGAQKAAMELWLDVRLSEREAAALAQELRTILGRVRDRSDARGRRYLIHVALAPT